MNRFESVEWAVTHGELFQEQVEHVHKAVESGDVETLRQLLYFRHSEPHGLSPCLADCRRPVCTWTSLRTHTHTHMHNLSFFENDCFKGKQIALSSHERHRVKQSSFPIQNVSEAKLDLSPKSVQTYSTLSALFSDELNVGTVLADGE